MTFLHWLGRQYDSGVNTVRRLWDRVHQAVAVLWHSLTSLGHVVGKAWGRFHNAVDHLGASLADLASATYARVRHVLTVVIPAGLTWVRGEAFKAAARLVADLRSWATHALRATTSWASRIVSDLRGWTSNAVRWLTGHIASLRADLTALRHAARYVLGGPDVAAGWLFGALVRVSGRWLRGNAEALVRYAAGHAVRLLLRSLPTVEHILTDIF